LIDRAWIAHDDVSRLRQNIAGQRIAIAVNAAGADGNDDVIYQVSVEI